MDETATAEEATDRLEPSHPADRDVLGRLAERMDRLDQRLDGTGPLGRYPGRLLHFARGILGRLDAASPAASAPQGPPVFWRHLLMHAEREATGLHDAFAALPAATLQGLRAPGGVLVLDQSTEGRAFRRVGLAMAEGLHRVLAHWAIPPGNVAWLQQNIALPEEYLAFARARGFAPMRVLFADAYLLAVWGQIAAAGPRATRGSWPVGFAVETEGPRPFRYVCLNHTLRGHRCLLASRLLALPAAGHLTFSTLRHRNEPARLLAEVGGVSLAEEKAANLAAVEALLASDIDRRGDVELGERLATLAASLPVAEVAGADLFVVTETEMAGPTLRRHTEKTIKALASGLPFIVFGNAGTIGRLRAHGFDVHDGLVDHGYDAEVDPARRFAHAWASLLRFLERPPGLRPEELDGLRRAAIANRAVLTGPLIEEGVLAPLDTILGMAGS